MATANTLRLDVASWIPASEWRDATSFQRGTLLDFVARRAVELKLAQIERQQGADGGRLAPRKRPRPDGARGPVLAPHHDRSRSEKWIRTSKGRDHVTIHWSHGWGVILGYHADGMVIGAPIRDIIRFPQGVMNTLKGETRIEWARLVKRRADIHAKRIETLTKFRTNLFAPLRKLFGR